MKAICILSFLFILQSLCEAATTANGDSNNADEAASGPKLSLNNNPPKHIMDVLRESLFPDEDRKLRWFPDLLTESSPFGPRCSCTNEDCECCSQISQHSVCTRTNIVEKEPKVLAIEGKIVVNNGSVFNYSAKLEDIPDFCFVQGNLDSCIKLKYEMVEEGKIKVCGHLITKYSKEVMMNVDFLCRVFVIIKKTPDNLKSSLNDIENNSLSDSIDSDSVENQNH